LPNIKLAAVFNSSSVHAIIAVKTATATKYGNIDKLNVSRFSSCLFPIITYLQNI
jgi:hypothetical protein